MNSNSLKIIRIFFLLLISLLFFTFQYSNSAAGGTIKQTAGSGKNAASEFKFIDNFSQVYCAPRAELDENEELTINLLDFTSPGAIINIELSGEKQNFSVKRIDNKIIIKNLKNIFLIGKPLEYRIKIAGKCQKYIIGTVIPAQKNFSADLSLNFKNYPELKETDEIYAAGEMNGWDQKSLKLIRTGPGSGGNNGDYTVNIPNIKKGEYAYKFIIGGKWLFDRENPEKAADEYGSFNSILKAGPVIYKPALIPGKISCQPGLINFNIKYAGNSPSPILICSYNGADIKTERIKYDALTKQFNIEMPSRTYFENDFKTHTLRFYSYAYDQSHGLAELSDEYSFNKFSELPVQTGFRDSIIYFAMTDRFYNGDSTNDRPISDKNLDRKCNYYGGDFSGLQCVAESGYFNSLNVNFLWISPVTAGPNRAFNDSLPPHRKFSGYHGYWPENLNKIEPRFGTLNELQELIKNLRVKNNIEILTDIALRHVTITSGIYKNNKNLFLSLYLPDGSKNIRKFDQFPESTWFDEFLPAFDFEKTESIEFMSNKAAGLIKLTGVNGMRLDAVKHIPYKFWSKFLNGRDNFFTVGETIDSREKIASYIAPGMITTQFDFPLYFAIINTFAKCSMDFTNFEQELKKSEKIFWNNHKLTSNLLGNHDFPRFMAYAEGIYDNADRPDIKELGFIAPPEVKNYKNYKKLQMAFGLLMSINGIPLIYYGDEYGETGAGDPDNRRRMRFNDELNFYEKQNIELVKFLTDIRKKHPALFEGVRIPILYNKNNYIFAKCHFNETIIVVFNRNEKPEMIKFNLPDYIYSNALNKGKIVFGDLRTGEKFESEINGRTVIPVHGYGFRYLKVLD